MLFHRRIEVAAGSGEGGAFALGCAVEVERVFARNQVLDVELNCDASALVFANLGGADGLPLPVCEFHGEFLGGDGRG